MQCINSRCVFSKNVAQECIPCDVVEKDNRRADMTNSFQITWRQVPTPSPLKWDQVALHTEDHVLGFLTLYLPVVACVYVHTVGNVKRLFKSVFTTNFVNGPQFLNPDISTRE